MVHNLSAWATDNKLVLGQITTDEKSNEITAIPALLNLIEIENCIVTMDAMGTQKSIAKDIINKKAHYILSLKANHPTFHEEVKTLFESPETLQEMKEKGARLEVYQTEEKNGGRYEKRSCVALEKVDWFEERSEWEGLKSIVMIERRRENVQSNKITQERHYYITSLEANAKQILEGNRKHWEIENSLHWVLDVTYREDDSRIRKDHAPENFSTLRKWSLNLIKQNKGKLSVKGARKKCAWNEQFLLEIINN